MHTPLHDILGVVLDIDELYQFRLEHFEPSQIFRVVLQSQVFHHSDAFIMVLQPHRILCYFKQTQSHIVKSSSNLDMATPIQRTVDG
jgi:hypothetical protein